MSELLRQRILIVTRNLPPLVGGMERLNWHMAEELAKTYEVKIIGPRGCASRAPSRVVAAEVASRPLWKFFLMAHWRSHQLVSGWKPDVVLAGSALTLPLARRLAKRCGAKTVLYAHGLDVVVRHPVYRAMWWPAIRSADRVVVNSGPTRQLCIDIGVPPQRIGVVHPGVKLPSGPAPVVPPTFESSSWQHRFPLLLSVGRLSARKGIREFVQNALPAIVKKYPETLLLVAGDVPSDALRATVQTPESILTEADKINVRRNIKFLGRVREEELSALYRAADVHVFPVQDLPNDPEGFGMVAIEAAAHGLPTVAFASGGVVDAVADGESGYLAPPGDYETFSKFVMEVLTGDSKAWQTESYAFARKFSWSRFGERMQSEVRSVIRQ